MSRPFTLNRALLLAFLAAAGWVALFGWAPLAWIALGLLLWCGSALV